MDITPEQLTAIALAIYTIARFLEFIGKSLYLEIKGNKAPTKDLSVYLNSILEQVTLANNNHSTHIEQAIRDGNDKIVQAINDLHLDLIKEIKK